MTESIRTGEIKITCDNKFVIMNIDNGTELEIAVPPETAIRIGQKLITVAASIYSEQKNIKEKS